MWRLDEARDRSIPQNFSHAAFSPTAHEKYIPLANCCFPDCAIDSLLLPPLLSARPVSPVPKIYKPGKVAVVLQGRHAGKKVVVIKQYDDGSKERSYPFVLAAGIERYPLKVTKSMGAKKLAKRSKVKPFIKVINYNHLMPTRYALELEGLKGAVSTETFKEPSQREDAKKVIKKLLEERYASGKNRWFFQPLRF
ncbi:hypothetical protein CF319_g4427 [Tilletia indica]|nr:hypothetical protein CF319_g4427 [Tilletia indica]